MSRTTPTLNDDYLNGRDVEKQIDYLLIGHDFLDGKDADDLKKWINGDISFGDSEDTALDAAKKAISECEDIDTLEAYANHLGSWEVLHLGLDELIQTKLDDGESLTDSELETVRAEIIKLIAGESDAKGFCDEFEIPYAIWFDARDSDADEYEELAQWLDLKEQAENYAGDGWLNCTLISEGKWVEYCQEFAYDCGHVERGSHIEDFIDWEKYAESCRADFSEIKVDGDIFYVRN